MMVVPKEPTLPWKLFPLMQLVDKVHEENGFLPMQVLNAETTFLHRRTNLLLVDLKKSSGVRVLAGPKKARRLLSIASSTPRGSKKEPIK
jgi:hypothetical protein